MELVNSFLVSIIPIMVTINAFGVLPVYVALTDTMDHDEKNKIARQSIITACVITIGFLFLGRAIFKALEIHVDDFMTAGGILLLVISIADMIMVNDRRAAYSATMGVVPLGTPLLAGPATLTTALILVGSYGYLPVICSLIVNLLIVWVVFNNAGIIIRVIGISGSRAFAKVSSLLLAAIAVRLIRSGVTMMLGE